MEENKIEENVAEKEASTSTVSNPAAESMASDNATQAKPPAPQLTGSDLEAYEAVEYVKARYPKAKQAYDNAENEYCRVKMEIGLYLFKKFWNSDEALFKQDKFAPNKANAYNKMLKDPEFPIKSAATLRNITKAGIQMHWLESQGITIDEAAELGWTNLIRLLPMKDCYDKFLVILMIQERNEKVAAGETQEDGKPYQKMTAAEVANAASRIRNPKPKLDKDIKAVLDGVVNVVAPVRDERFLEDLRKAKVKNDQGKYAIEDERRKQMRDTITEAKEKINKILRQLSAMLEELKKPRDGKEGSDGGEEEEK